MKNRPSRSLFSRHISAFAAGLAACAVSAVFLPGQPCLAGASELAQAGPAKAEQRAEQRAGPTLKAGGKAAPEAEKRNSWSIFHRDGKSTVSIYYPHTGNARIDDELAHWSDARLRTFVSGVAALGEGKSRYGMEIDYTLSQASPRYLSVVFRISTETGGTRPDLGFTTFTYDLAEGRALSLKELFRDPAGLLLFLSDYAREELQERLGRGERELLLRGTSPSDVNFEFFALRPDGLEIIFPPYQVAGSGRGEQSVTVPLEKLLPYGPDPQVWDRKKQS